mmetsp:Transcript_29858/g.55949  ORF Transcript_29858/g.55949 Transcript_29858/m.55949 type:complete len:93 (-) Transcript_29858:960-1238(-)
MPSAIHVVHVAPSLVFTLKQFGFLRALIFNMKKFGFHPSLIFNTKKFWFHRSLIRDEEKSASKRSLAFNMEMFESSAVQGQQSGTQASPQDR